MRKLLIGVSIATLHAIVITGSAYAADIMPDALSQQIQQQLNPTTRTSVKTAEASSQPALDPKATDPANIEKSLYDICQLQMVKGMQTSQTSQNGKKGYSMQQIETLAQSVCKCAAPTLAKKVIADAKAGKQSPQEEYEKEAMKTIYDCLDGMSDGKAFGGSEENSTNAGNTDDEKSDNHENDHDVSHDDKTTNEKSEDASQ